MKRKHVRTRESKVLFSRTSREDTTLTPGVYRLFYQNNYYASFIVKKDRTVEFYGHKLLVEREDLDGVINRL